MMAYEMKDNSGSLFRNDRKETDTQPEYKGSTLIDGTDFWLDAWINESSTGVKYMSLRFKPKEVRNPTGAQGAPIAQQPADLDDDVPFISDDASLEWRVG